MMKFRVSVLLGLVLLAATSAAFWLSGCNSKPSGDAAVVKIVSSLPRTGSGKVQSDSLVNGIRLALDEGDNKASGFKVEYLDWDDATATAGHWTAEAEAANADRAVKDPDVMVYIGTMNS